jgi:hypothetical protein
MKQDKLQKAKFFDKNRRRSLQTKSQITIFIIIGIVILVGATLLFVLRTTQQPSSEEEIIKKTIETPTEFKPINDFIVSCISNVGKDGIRLLGFHGGYIDLNKYGIQARASNPTESRAFLFNTQDTNSGVAYWNYFQSDNQCTQGCSCGTEQPFLYKKDGAPNIEEQLDSYIEENLDICLNDFESFKRNGFDIKTIGDIKATTQVRENDVLFYVNYEVKAKKGESEFQVKEYITIVPVELRKIYELADELREKEVNFTYLERWTVEQIAGLGLGIDENRLPPMAASELSPGKRPVYWIKQKVKNDIQNNMLPLYTPALSVYETKNYNYGLLGTFYERATLPIDNPNDNFYRDLDVKFNYLNWWPIYFDITGRGISGQKIGPETASSSLMSFIGVKRYNFYYDVSYPVIVDIYSEDAFNQEGFHFYFGLEANVRNNEPLNCSGEGIKEYAYPSGSMFCNYDQGCANVTMHSIDAKTQQPLDDVTIFYSAGSESCDKGFTKDGKAVASLPQCVGSACSVNAVKEGYWYYPKTFAVRCDASFSCSNEDVLCDKESLQLNMEPFRDSDITIMKKKMLKQAQKTWAFNNVAEPLLDNEYAVITLEKIKDNINEEDLILSGIYYGNQTSINFYPGLIPGNYETRIDLFYEFPDYKGRDYVEFKEVKQCQSTYFGLSKTCTTIGPYNITNTIIEGSFLTNITITKDMLDNHNKIIFYTISSPDIDTSYNILDVYDMEEMVKAENYSMMYRVELKPTAQ